MPSEPETENAQPVPSVWRLGWLLFMQPVTLHRMYRAWGVERDPSLIKLWRLGRLRDPVVRALMARYALLLFVVMPFTAVLMAGALTLSGVPVAWFGVAFSVTFGVAFGIATSLVSLQTSVAFGMAFGVAGGVAFGVVGMQGGVAGGVAAGVAVGVAGGAMIGVAQGGGLVFVPAVALVFGVSSGLFGGSMPLRPNSVEFGVMIGVTGVTSLRLPIWLVESLLMQWLAWGMRRRPDAVRRLAS